MHERNHILDVLTHVPLDEFLKATAIQARGNYQPGTVLEVLRQPALVEKPREIAEATKQRMRRRIQVMLRQKLSALQIATALGVSEEEVTTQQDFWSRPPADPGGRPKTRVLVVRNS